MTQKIRKSTTISIVTMMNSSRLLLSARQSHRRLVGVGRNNRRFLSNSSANKSASNKTTVSAIATASTAILVTTAAAAIYNKNNETLHHYYSSPAAALCSAPPLLGAEATMLSPATEPKTGILFPRLCNGMTFVGCGVRVKYGFVKVYAVGTYMDPLAMSSIKTQSPNEIKKALLDPTYPRTIRIVMNRNLSMEKYTTAIIEALEPRMGGQDMNSLEEFKNLNPKGLDLVQGAEMEMTIRGDTLLYKNAVGGIGQIKSLVFTRAMCDVFYGEDAVSPPHLDEVLKGVKAL